MVDEKVISGVQFVASLPLAADDKITGMRMMSDGSVIITTKNARLFILNKDGQLKEIHQW